MKYFHKNAVLFRLICLFAITFSTSLAYAGESSLEIPVPSWLDFARKDVGNWPDRIISDTKSSFFDNNNLITLLLAGGGSIALHSTDADKNIAGNMERHRAFRSKDVDKFVDLAGNPGMHFAATGIWYVISDHKGDQLNKDRAWTMMTALSVTGLTTLALKGIVHNQTPNGKNFAWPSGHTSSSFTVAAVLHEFYGPEIGIPAYCGASVVAWRMMDSGDHWASDVLFGAVLGWVVGHTVAGKQKKLEVAGFKIEPYFGGIGENGGSGICLTKRF